MDQWNPRLDDGTGTSLYGAMMRRIRAVGGRIAGVLWYQGESDTSPEQLEVYCDRMTCLVTAMRNDLAQPDMPFCYVQLGCVADCAGQNVAGWNGIREQQRRWSETIAGIAMVPAIDLGLDDPIHLATNELKRLGRRLAEVVAGHPPLALAGVTVDGPRITVLVDQVQGELRSNGRPTGFSLRDNHGRDLLGVFKITLEADRVALYLDPGLLPSAADLWYGWGLDPYCNITDRNDAALPAFGPIRIQGWR